MNNKGLTLVELLAVIAIMGILSSATIIAVSKHLSRSKTQAYETMEQTAYHAAVNYILSGKIQMSSTETNIKVKDLVDNNYMDNPIDPNKKGSPCTGDESYVTITKQNETENKNNLDNYTYTVHIVCPSGYKSGNGAGVKYPKEESD